MPQLTYNLVPPVAVEGMIASEMEGTIIVPRLAEGLVPVGLLAAPGTSSLTGPPLTTVSSASTTPGQVKKLPGGLVADPMVGSSWVGVPIYDASRQPYDDSLGYSSYQDETTVPVLIRGPIYVKPEAGAISQGGAVYVRTAVNGALDKLGRFAPAAGAGLVLFPQGRWISGLMQGTFAILYVEF